jgi:hypothetical protein
MIMRKLVVSIVIASAAVTAAPATAQYWRLSQSVHREIRQDINQLENRIERAADRRRISQREATSLLRDARHVRRLYRNYTQNGLTRREVADLEWRVNRVQQRLRMERRDWDGRRG